MSSKDALILFLTERDEDAPRWMRVVDGVAVKAGEGADWLAACGLAALPEQTRVMLVPPAPLVRLHWVSHPDLPARQGRAAARLAAIAQSILPADQLFAAPDANDDPARPHIVAVAARADMQHWLLRAQHHGLDPDIIVPAPLLLPEPDGGFVRGVVGDETIWRGGGLALTQELAPLDMRQGDFAKRVRRAPDMAMLRRIALLSGIILLLALATAVVGIVKNHGEASRLDDQSVALARQILPEASDAAQAQGELDARLAARGAGARAFTAPVAGLFAAMQDAPGVALTSLSRDPDGMIRATLAAAKADDINIVLLALQAAGFVVTATPSQDPGGRTLADITVRS